MTESGSDQLAGLRDEVARRLVHASGAAVPVAWLLGAPWWLVQAFMVVAAVGAAVLEAVRLFVGLEWVVFDKLTREYEQDNPAGYALYMWSVAAVVLAFGHEPRIAVVAMLALSLGDPISGLLASGELRTVKRPRVLLAMFATTLVLAWPFLPLSAALVAAVGATVADGVKPRFRGVIVDDNLSIPIVVAVAAWAAMRYLPSLAPPLGA
ncbi:dolichol kinase [Halorubellus sp. JP-L1]|uniref:dolichol kinase n=1 Tax=Halorubellus sp. JP-L1 TaxID=2715753 RepID=UPI0034E93840